MDSIPRLQPLLVDLILYNASSNSILNPLYQWIGYDIVASLGSFFTNVETDPYDESNNQSVPVGFYFFFRHMPFFWGKCERGVDDRAVVGMGIGKATVYLLLGVVGISLILYYIWPPLGSVYTTILVFLGLSGIVSIWLTMAWTYNVVCFSSSGGNAIILGAIFNRLQQIPTLPEYAPTDIQNAIETIFNSSCGFVDYAYLLLNREPPSPSACTLCNPDGSVDEDKEFNSCTSYEDIHLKDYLTLVQMEIYALVPGLVQFLNKTCLVRGGCFSLSGNMNVNSPKISRTANEPGELASLILPPTAITTLKEGNTTTSGQRLKACRSLLLITRVSLWYSIAVAFFMLYSALAILCGFIESTLTILSSYITIPKQLIFDEKMRRNI